MRTFGIALLGGSFNPPHTGHLRLAIEVSECLASLVDRVLLVPSARPPHKQGNAMLPFRLRCSMLEECVASLERIEVSRVEGERSDLSYTWDTLLSFRSFCPDTDFYFVLGSDDYLQLPDWYKGLELPELTHFIIVPRGDFSSKDFLAATSSLWPEARITECVQTGLEEMICAELPQGSRSLFFPLKRLEISATDIRRRFREGKCVDFLVPAPVAASLEKNHDLIAKVWEK